MFDIGWGELVVIGIVALIAIGPKELPAVLRTLGQYMAKLKRMSAEFQSQFQEALREAEVADLKKHAADLESSVHNVVSFNEVTDAGNAEKKAAIGAGAPTDIAATNDTTPVKISEPVINSAGTTHSLPQTNTASAESPTPISTEDFADTLSSQPKRVGGDV